jgi:hypothetical protein
MKRISYRRGIVPALSGAFVSLVSPFVAYASICPSTFAAVYHSVISFYQVAAFVVGFSLGFLSFTNFERRSSLNKKTPVWLRTSVSVVMALGASLGVGGIASIVNGYHALRPDDFYNPLYSVPGAVWFVLILVTLVCISFVVSYGAIPRGLPQSRQWRHLGSAAIVVAALVTISGFVVFATIAFAQTIDLGLERVGYFGCDDYVPSRVRGEVVRGVYSLGAVALGVLGLRVILKAYYLGRSS